MANTIMNAKSTKAKNPLNSYRSYNYIFTIASLSKTALSDPLSYRDNQDYFVIAKSGGKGSKGLKAPDDPSNAQLVTDFNQNSPGRFDFYINNVHIETIMGQNNKTSLSVATNIEFDIMEPYSMTGWIEALQVSAVAAGYAQYTTCPYLLKMEFVGYPDNEYLPETATVVPNATRYFVFGFTGIDMDVTEEGARYHCKCVPFNEKGFGDPSVLKSSIQIVGKNVGSILNNFAEALNQAAQSDARASKGADKATKCDEYQITIPKVDETGIVKDSTNEAWFNCQGINLLKDNAVYKFPDPIAQNTATTTVRYDPGDPSIFFAERSNIHECIVSIIRDSDYAKDLLKDFPKNVDPNTGMVDYFMVHLEVEDKGVVDDTETHKPFYIYRYVVIPYKMHYTRIPLAQNQTVDTSNLVTVVNREYDYLYTGANTDIQKFNLKFNTLFFQAIPPALGNKKDKPAAVSGTQPEGYIPSLLVSKPTEEIKESSLGVQPVKVYPDFTQIQPMGVPNSGQPSDDPFAALAKNLHQAILDNVDQCTADIDIIGDPFYLVTGGMGNYRPVINTDANSSSPVGTAGEGEAPYTTQDVMIIVTFRNPSDIDKETGEAIFDQVTAPYSGVFRVIQVTSEFKDGVFTQKLSTVRLPAQLLDTNVPIKPRAALVGSAEFSPDAPIPIPAEPVSTLRASPDSLFASITAGLPVAGLPGNLSQLITSAAGSLGGAVSSAAAGIVQWGQTAASAGISGVTPASLAGTTLASGLSSAGAIGSSAMSAVTGLGTSAAGVVSGVAAKVSALNGGTAAALGIDTSSLSGLSSNLQAKASQQLTDAINSIPSDVDVSLAVNNGLILNNIPKSALANIPSTQPILTAPLPEASLTDIKAILDRGGSLANIPGASSIPGVDKLLASSGINLPSGLGLDAASVAGKLSTAQAGLSSITGQIPSVESALNSISAAVPTGLPNVAGVSSSVVSKFGSASASAASPLSTIMKSVS